jgi:YD repeat-containing protein
LVSAARSSSTQNAPLQMSFSPAPRSPLPVRAAIGLALALAIATGTAVAGTPVAASASFAHRVAASPRLVRGSSVKRAAATALSTTQKRAIARTATAAPVGAVLPTGSITTGSVSAGAGRDVGTLAKAGVSLAVAAPGLMLASPVRLSVLSTARAGSLGGASLAFSVSRANPFAASSTVAVTVPSSLVDAAGGGNLASRTTWVARRSVGSSAVRVASRTVATSTGSKTVLSVQLGATPVLLSAQVSADSVTGTGLYSRPPGGSDAATVVGAASSTISVTAGPRALAATSTVDPTAPFAAPDLTPSTTPVRPADDLSVVQRGDFTWAYPLTAPPATGPSPSLSLAYDSQSVDGETGATNNQPSAIGDGWQLGGAGYIQRTFESCRTNGTSKTAHQYSDLCWKSDNATISFRGTTSELVKDRTTHQWHLANDDGSRVQHLVGTAAGCASNGTKSTDCWRLTTTDGTQYYFGLNRLPGYTNGDATTKSTWTVPVFGNAAGEPCHKSTFAASSCNQAWRWNLDYVVDAHGNAESLYYAAETNRYSKRGHSVASYIRGGQLLRVDYGFRAGQAYAKNAASSRVTLGYDAKGRCLKPTSSKCTTETLGHAAKKPAHPSYYPDVPFDLLCATGSCSHHLAPTFWTTAMLDTVTTSVLKGGSYATVSSWTLKHTLPKPGDGTSPELWLASVAHSASASSGTISVGTTRFVGETLQNRVWVVDGLPPLDKYRVEGIYEESGSSTFVHYAQPNCTVHNVKKILASPQSNTSRCFPERWTPDVQPRQGSQRDLFHRYVVQSLLTSPGSASGLNQTLETTYHYGAAAWRYQSSPLVSASNRTWSVFMGFASVSVRHGTAGYSASPVTTTDYRFFRGMDGDRRSSSGGTKKVFVIGSSTVRDAPAFAGRVRSAVVRNGPAGATLSQVVSTPWTVSTAYDGLHTARYVRDRTVVTTEPLASGGSRSVTVTTVSDVATGLPLTVDTARSDAASSCSTTSYAAPNRTAWIVGLPAQVLVVGRSCADIDSAVMPDDSVSAVRFGYDGGDAGSAATVGDLTSTRVVDRFDDRSASSAHWSTITASSFDAAGRLDSSTDALGNTTTTSYQPAASAPAGSGGLQQTTVTAPAPFSWKTVTDYDTAWGRPISVRGAGGTTQTMTWDALGRPLSLWDIGRSVADYPTSPSVRWIYFATSKGISARERFHLTGSGSVATAYLSDGLGRIIQTQRPGWGSVSLVADRDYDSAGRLLYWSDEYAANVSPSTTLFVPYGGTILPEWHTLSYDGADRLTADSVADYGAVRMVVTHAYRGADVVDTVDPSAGSPTRSVVNSKGLLTSLTTFAGAAILPTAATRESEYSYDARGDLLSSVDAAGKRTTRQWDAMGRQLEINSPDSGVVRQSYDLNGLMASRTDARGVRIGVDRDALGRVTDEYAGTSRDSGALLHTWQWDTLRNGELASSSTYVGSSAGHPGAEYRQSVTAIDAAGSATEVATSLPADAPAFAGQTFTRSFTYDSAEAVKSTAYPSEGGLAAEAVRSNRDVFGAVASLSTDDRSLRVLVSRDWTGRASQYTRYSADRSLVTGFGRGLSSDRPVDIIDQSHAGTGSYAVDFERQESLDAAGRASSARITQADGSTTLECDRRDGYGALTEQWTKSAASASTNCDSLPAADVDDPAAYWNSYGYGAASGNRTSVVQHALDPSASTVTDSYLYVDGSDELLASVTHVGGSLIPDDDYAYDAAGNATTIAGATVERDSLGRVASAAKNGTTESTVYDASGVPLLRTNSVTGSDLFLGDTVLHLGVDETEATAIRTYSIDGFPVAERRSTPGQSGSAVSWVAADADDTINLEVDPATGAVQRRDLDRFGTVVQQSGGWSDLSGLRGGIVSPITGLVSLDGRDYDPTTGRDF